MNDQKMFSAMLNARHYDKLDWLQAKTGITSRSELIRQLIDNATVATTPSVELPAKEPTT